MAGRSILTRTSRAKILKYLFMNIWSISQIEDQVQYRLQLCQSAEGRRYYRLATADQAFDRTIEDVVLVTDIVPHSLLRKRDLIEIAHQVRLSNGDAYCVEAHGMWLTLKERDQFFGRVPFSEIEWASGKEPVFPPK